MKPIPTRLVRGRRPVVLARAILALLTLTLAAGAACQQAPGLRSSVFVDGTAFASMAVWNDGFAEMAYYDAVDTLYGKERSYTRVHLLNQQHMDATEGVKDPAGNENAVAVFKFSIAEEIPTENYNYRFLTTAFIKRGSMRPFKLATSSQEWCGTTYKSLRWSRDELSVASFSYFPNEGDKTWTRKPKTVPVESLFVVARAALAAGVSKPVRFDLLPEMRDTHEVVPDAMSATLTIDAEPVGIETEAGTFVVRRVRIDRGDSRSAYTFDVATTEPYALVAYEVGDTRGALRFVERRPYWDGASRSTFYKANAAP